MILPQLPHLITVSLSILLSILVTIHGDSEESTEDCSDLKCSGKEILQSISDGVDPCVDFYQHTCGGWISANPVKLTWPMVLIKSHFSDLMEKTHTQIFKIINNTQSDDTEALKKAKIYYRSCMDTDAIERHNLKPLETILTENGEWPLIVPPEQWNPQKLEWQRIHENFANSVGISALFDVSVNVERGKDRRTLTLNIPTAPSARKVQRLIRPKRDTKSSGHKTYLIEAAVALKKSRGFNVTDDDFREDIEGIVMLEEMLNKIATLPEEDDDDNASGFRVMTIETLQENWDNVVKGNSKYSIDWLKIINDRFAGTGIVIDDSEKIVLTPKTLVEDLAALLIDTHQRTIVNYIHWKAIDMLLPFTKSRIQNPTVLSAFAPKRAGKCINDHKMIHAVSYMYVKKYFNRESRIKALEMVEHIRDEIKREIRDSLWLDDPTKLVAQEKIDGMTNFIGYPEWYDEPNEIDEYYNGLTVGSDYFTNGVTYIKFEEKKKLAKYRSPVSKTDIRWLIYPYIVNAGYDKETNSLNFPAAILQSPFFVYNRPSIVNYGAFGAIVGHEISHAFDREGRLYTKNGHKREWWTQSTIDTYKTKAQCFIDQYNEYIIYENPKTYRIYRVDGVKNQGENIADGAGFRAALRAYNSAKSNQKSNNGTSELPTNVADNKLYFYGLAYTFCESVLEMGLAMYATLPHCPSRLRIIGALSNMEEFSEAFECPIGSPMNPSNKCILWN